MFDADEILFEVAKDTLDHCSISRRRIILQALRVKLSSSHPACRNVEAQLAMLDALEKLQSELSFAK